MKSFIVYSVLSVFTYSVVAQELTFKKQKFEIKNVTASVTKLDGREVIKVERDLKALPFDISKLGSTVDEPTYIKLKDVDFENGVIEVKMFSEIQNPPPFPGAQGFIGVAFRINENDTEYESIYLRPRVGRSDDQFARNHTVQYYAYPDFKFDVLRKEAPGKYETTAPVNIGEWITMRIEVDNEKVHMFINDAKYSTFVVEKMKGKTKRGSIALWVDIGTIGYFKDLKVTKR
jgi:hypothetical protein